MRLKLGTKIDLSERFVRFCQMSDLQVKICQICRFPQLKKNARRTTDGPTDGRTDRPSYRDAWTHLKIVLKLFLLNSDWVIVQSKVNATKPAMLTEYLFCWNWNSCKRLFRFLTRSHYDCSEILFLTFDSHFCNEFSSSMQRIGWSEIVRPSSKEVQMGCIQTRKKY